MDESSPGRILFRLEELRRWQRSQEKILEQRQAAQKKQLADEYSESCQSPNFLPSSDVEISANNSSSFTDHYFPSDCENDLQFEKTLTEVCGVMEGVSALNISKESAPYLPPTPASEVGNVSVKELGISNVDKKVSKIRIEPNDVPIFPSAGDFKSLLEEKIKNNDAGISVQKKSQPKIITTQKKPHSFLRRGQGMVRYNMTSDDIGLSVSRKNCPRVKRSRKVAEKSWDGGVPAELLQPRDHGMNVKSKKKLDYDWKADENGPIPDLPSFSNYGMEVPESETKKEPFQLGKSKGTWASLLTEEQEHYLMLLNSKNDSQFSVGSGYSHTDSPSLDKIKSYKEVAEQNMFDLLEKKVENSSFCSTSSFVARVVGIQGTDTPTANRDYVNTFPHVLNLKSGLTDIKTIESLNSSKGSFDNCKRNGQESCDENNDTASIKCSIYERTDVESTENDDEYSESTDSEPTSKLTLKQCISTSTPNQGQNRKEKHKNHPTPSRFQEKKVIKIMICQDSEKEFKIVEGGESARQSSAEDDTLTHGDDDITGSLENSEIKCNIMKNADFSLKAELLKTRLRELESEIEIFKKENDSLSKMKCELNTEKEAFLKEKAETERKLNEDKIISEYYLAEEKEKLAKQKQLYDRHVKDMKGNSAKKEREEIAVLKKELSELKEQMKIRDAKVGTAQARLRNQLKNLEKESADLKIESEKLKKENTRLRNASLRSRRLSNIKSLAEINKSLAQFTVDNHMTEVEIEDIFPENNISKECTEQLRPYNIKSCKTTKATVIKHQKPIQRSKSVPNLGTMSHYAKYFSQRDEEQRQEAREQFGYGLHSESDESIHSDMEYLVSSQPVHASQDFFKFSHLETGNLTEQKKNNLPNMATDKEFEDDPNKKRSCLRKLSDVGGNNRFIEQMYAEKFEEDTTSVTRNRPQSATEIPSTKLWTDRGDSIDHVVIDRPDGSKEIRFDNGNTKVVSVDESYSKFIYYNGDIKETFYNEGTIKYYYKEVNTHHTTYKDGSQVLQFPDGQIERRYPDGSVESCLSDGATRWARTGGTQEWRFPDGTVLVVERGGDRTLRFPNGQVEVHTEDHKRREFPDGTVKVVYSDGVMETRYANGRVRVKDRSGNLLMDYSGSR